MKKLLAILLVVAMAVAMLAACAEPAADPTPQPTTQAAATPTPTPEAPPVVELTRLEELLAEYGLDENMRFHETRSISVLAWERDNDPTITFFADWLKEQMLEIHNVEVEYVTVGRWSEIDDLTLLLAEGSAPDACYTFNYPTVETFANQGAITDLEPYLAESGDIFPNLWDWLGYKFLYFNQSRETGTIWAIEGKQSFNQRFISFIREDWLATLGMSLPTNLDEFEAALYAFKDNADTLLGSDARQLIPLHMTDDIGWVAGMLVESFIPDSITDKDYYIHSVGGDARKFFFPGAKEAIRYLNKWFNDGLIHPDFALFTSGDDTADNLLRAGFVGAIASHSWDQPYRDGADGWTGRMHSAIGEEANFIAVNAFRNDAGAYRKYLGAGNDRKLFVPATSTEPIAALLYWDFLCRTDTIRMLQMGVEGINHEVMPDGALRSLPRDAGDYHQMTSGMNYDLNMPTNGLWLGDAESTAKSAALGYAGVEPRLIEIARSVQLTDARSIGNTQTPTVQAEDGMGDTIREQGNAAWARAIVAPVDQFDAVYDAEMATLYSNFATAGMAERETLWASVWGDATMLPTEG